MDRQVAILQSVVRPRTRAAYDLIIPRVVVAAMHPTLHRKRQSLI